MITKITFLSCEKSENVNCKKQKKKNTEESGTCNQSHS